MRVVAFTGMPGAGKSEAVEVARSRQLPIVRMGEFVWAETQAQGLPLTDEYVGRVATKMRQENGPQHWARRTTDHIERHHAGAPIVVIDGVRTLDEVAWFRQRLGDKFHLIAIVASEAVRAKRLLSRGRADDVASTELVRRRDERERAWGIEKAIATADARVPNEGLLVDFRKAVATALDLVTSAAGPGSAT